MNILYCKTRVYIIAFFVLLQLSTNQMDAQIALGQTKFLGNTWYGSTPPSKFSVLWNQLTPENATKWGACEPTQGYWQFGDATFQNRYCQNNKIPFKFHCLVWQNQAPSWITGATDQKAAVEAWIARAALMFPNADYVDVVNEPTHFSPPRNIPDPNFGGDKFPAWFNAIGGYNLFYGTGWDYIVWSFKTARKYFPNSKLLINDYHILNTYGDIDRYMSIIKILKDSALIDGIGCQAHFLENTSGAEVKKRLDKLATLGLPIYISEFDLNIADDNQQRIKLAELFPVMWTHPAVKGITFWDYLQGHTWQTNAYLVKSDGTDRQAMTWLKNYLNPPPAGYTYAGSENSMVKVTGTMNIAYGANGNFVYKYNQTSNCNCADSTFNNQDPAPNQVKSCFTQVVNTSAVNTVEANNNRLSVFPNPTNDLLNVDLTDFIQSNVQLSIIDMRGRVVYQQILNNQTKAIISTKKYLQVGIYIVKVVSQNRTAIQKIWIEK